MYKLELNLELIKTNFKKSFEGLLTSQRFRVSRVFLSFFLFSILYHARIAHTSNNPRVFFNPYSPSMEFFYKILLSEEVFNKIEMNIYGFIFEKKKTNLVQKSQNIFSSVDANRRRVQVFFKKKNKVFREQ